MYLFERELWAIKTESAEERARLDTATEASFGKRKHRQLSDKPERELGVGDRVSDNPTDADSVYAVNDTFLEVRAAFQEEKRGLLTFGLLFLGGTVSYMLGWQLAIWPLFYMLVFGTTPWDRPIEVGDWFFVTFQLALFVAICYVFVRYMWRWVRLEVFTQRHILARFNRMTRQVHLHRPGYAGGIVTLPWEATAPGVEPEASEASGIGGFLIAGWPFEQSGAGYDEIAFLGRPMRGNSEIVDFWEFIRRYMEEGPESVPKPKRFLPRFPWPWESVRATLRFAAPMWRHGGKAFVLVTGLLLSPLIALHALCHWISLLLCWEPRWPKEIAEAGQPGKPVPKLTTADDFGPDIAANLRRNALADRQESSKSERRRKVDTSAAV